MTKKFILFLLIFCSVMIIGFQYYNAKPFLQVISMISIICLFTINHLVHCYYIDNKKGNVRIILDFLTITIFGLSLWVGQVAIFMITDIYYEGKLLTSWSQYFKNNLRNLIPPIAIFLLNTYETIRDFCKENSIDKIT